MGAICWGCQKLITGSEHDVKQLKDGKDAGALVMCKDCFTKLNGTINWEDRPPYGTPIFNEKG